MQPTRALVPALTATLLVPFLGSTAQAHGGDELKVGRALAAVATSGNGVNMDFVANVQHRLGRSADMNTLPAVQDGSDIEFAKIAGREYALAGTLRNGLQINDITDPTKPVKVGIYDCRITQGDIQVFTSGLRTLVSYTADSAIGAANASNQCVTEATQQGTAFNATGGPKTEFSGRELGTFIVDISNPRQPRTVSFLEIPTGSHNQSISPDGRYLYNSNSDLLTNTSPAVAIWDLADPARPQFVRNYAIPFTPTSLGSNSHDIWFAPDGKRAYVAALSQTVILDTTDLADPKRLAQPVGFVPSPTVPDAGRIVDPANNVVHQSDTVTLTRANGTDRTLLIVTDERLGAAASAECPGGGLHVYDITGDLELRPVKLGTWFIGDRAPSTGICTAHVLRIYPEQKLMTIAWYTKGVRVLDLSKLADFEPPVPGTGDAVLAYGDGVGMTEIGSYTFADGNTWSFKTNKIAGDSSFYGYGNDLNRGMDVYRFQPATARATTPLEPVQTTDEVPAPVVSDARYAILLPLAALGLAILLMRRRRSEDGTPKLAAT